ncbi:MAG: ATP-binding protein [Bacillota bacterium]
MACRQKEHYSLRLAEPFKFERVQRVEGRGRKLHPNLAGLLLLGNPRLAEAFKRVGFIEQTGRGVDKIYMGQLHYGRPIPDYSRSDSEGP